MNTPKPFGTIGHPRPWASARHRSRVGLMETLRREYGGGIRHPHVAEAIGELSDSARRDIRADRDGGAL